MSEKGKLGEMINRSKLAGQKFLRVVVLLARLIKKCISALTARLKYSGLNLLVWQIHKN